MFKPGDRVETILTVEEQNTHRRSDHVKGKKEGITTFIGRAAAYMHTDEAYVVEEITENGGLRLRGFDPTVSPKDVRPSKLPTYR